MSNSSLPVSLSNQLSEALYRIYGVSAASQEARYQNAIQRFCEEYGPSESEPIHIFRVPGRVNLIGEHTDYNHGYVMPVALDKDLLLLARPRTDQQIRLSNIEPAFPPVEFTLTEKIPQAESDSWSNYARGSGQVLCQHLTTFGHELRGFDGLIVSEPPTGIPKGAGLSSSTALTVAMAVALLSLSQQTLAPSLMAQLCSDAEWYVGTRGGIMDQFATLFAQQGHALFLDCRPTLHGDYHFEHIPLPDDHHLLVVDSGVHHENTRNEFNQRVAACRAGVALLRRVYPDITHLRDVQDVDWQHLESELPEQITLDALYKQGVELGDIPGLKPMTTLQVRARCRHIWTENSRVQEAVSALRNQHIAQLGTLLELAHSSARDDYEISCPEVETLIQAANQVEGVVGARLTGAGWGGCIIALVHQEAVNRFEEHTLRMYHSKLQRHAMIFSCRASSGAENVLTLSI